MKLKQYFVFFLILSSFAHATVVGVSAEDGAMALLPYTETVFEDYDTYYKGTVCIYHGSASNVLYIAKYKNNAFVSADARDYTGDVEQFTVGKEEADAVKIMLWRDWSTLSPLSEVESIDLSGLAPIPTPKQVTVTVYSGYGDYKTQRAQYALLSGQTLAGTGQSLISTTTRRQAFKKNATVASVYEGENYYHTARSSFWYLKDGKLIPFDETTTVYKDADVYRLFSRFGLDALIQTESGEEPVLISSLYNDSTRLIDALKEMDLSAKSQLQLAISSGWLPEYEEINDMMFGDLVESGIVDGNMNLQMVSVSSGALQSMSDAVATALKEAGIYDAFTTEDINIVEGILRPLYAQAQDVLVSKLQNAAEARYDENKYVKYLAEYDMISALLAGDGVTSDTSLGYALKPFIGSSSEDSYYDYMMRLMIVGDDAICWYGADGTLSQTEYDAAYQAIVGKIGYVRDRLDALLAACTDAEEIYQVLTKVQQVNRILEQFEPQMDSMLTKYFEGCIGKEFVDGTFADSANVKHVVDVLLEKETSSINIDVLYDLFYRFDAFVQSKLKQLETQGKLREAVEQFESSSFGVFFKGNTDSGNLAAHREEIEKTGKLTGSLNSIYDLLILISDYGIEPFQVEDSDEMMRDSYQFSIGKNVFTVHRKITT